MPGQRPILAMSFIASLGITFDVLACTLPKGNSNFWPMIVFVTYILLPIPLMFSKRVVKETQIGMSDVSASKVRDYALFFTAGLAVSSMALPIILARTPVEKPIVSKSARNCRHIFELTYQNNMKLTKFPFKILRLHLCLVSSSN